MKFVPSCGSVNIWAYVSGTKHRPEYVIKITDTGTGIIEDELPSVRNRFFRIKNAGTTSGIGLGLSIIGELVILIMH